MLFLGADLIILGSAASPLADNSTTARVHLLFRLRQQEERPRRFDFLQAALEFPLHNQGLANLRRFGGGVKWGFGCTGLNRRSLI